MFNLLYAAQVLGYVAQTKFLQTPVVILTVQQWFVLSHLIKLVAMLQSDTHPWN